MKLQFFNLSPVKFKGNDKPAKRINLQIKPDVVDFSNSKAKKKNDIIEELASTGIDKAEATEYYDEYGSTDEYKQLTQGDENGESIHFIDMDRNLTPAEAILYQAYGMEDYYCQHPPFCILPDGYEKGNLLGKKEIKQANFSPLELATTMNKEKFDMVLSGMVLKHEIDIDTARKLNEYSCLLNDNWDKTSNVEYSERNIEMVLDKLEKIEALTSQETNEDGTLTSNLTRPLTKEEAVSVYELNLGDEPENLNFYIWAKDTKNLSFARTSIELGFESGDSLLYEYKTGKKPEKKIPQVSKFPASKMEKPTNLDEYVDLIEFIKKDKLAKSPNRKKYLGALRKLDSNKYFRRIPMSTINFDLIMAPGAYFNEDLINRNIEVLNNVPDEILDKIKHFATIQCLLTSETLKEDVEKLEAEIKDRPDALNSKTRRDIMNIFLHKEPDPDTDIALKQIELLHEGYSAQEVIEMTKPQEDNIVNFRTKED